MTDSLKTLIFDIETLPNIVLEWEANPKYPITNHKKILKERAIACIGYKWFGEKKRYGLSLLDHLDEFHKDPYNDRPLLEAFSKVLEEADVVVAHNGDKFDMPWINGRLLYHRLPPMPRVVMQDTCKIAREAFKLNFNSLDYLAKYLGLSGKIGTTFDNWVNVATKKSLKDLEHLVHYCKNGDVPLLEEVYKIMRPYIKVWSSRTTAFPQASDGKCPTCGSEHIHVHDSRYYKTLARLYKRYRCQKCGHTFRGSKAVKMVSTR